MAQPPPDQNYYHHSHSHPHPHSHAHPHPQLQLPPQFRNPFDLLFDERSAAINYNYIRPYIPNQLSKPDELVDPLVMRRPRRTRTTFTSAQIAELEQHFLQGRYLTSSRLAELSAKLALGTAQVKIWFKNRRRRHKIQTDQQKDLSTSFGCDGLPLSPSMPQIKNDPIGPPNLQSLSLAGSNSVATPNTLTPSPTPSTSNVNVIEHYGESYYYNNSNHHGAHGGGPLVPATSHPHAHHPIYPPTTVATAATMAAQFFSTQSSGVIQHQHQNHHHQQHQRHQHQQHHATQYRAHPHTQHHHHHHHHHQQYDYQQQKAQTGSVHIKNETDFNYNNNNASYYARMSSAAAAAAATAANAAAAVKTASASSVVADGPTTAMSPHSEVYEPLTPKNDESPMSLCNGGVDAPDEMDESNANSLQVLVSNTISGGGGSGNDVCTNLATATNARDISIMDDCSGLFTKYNKISNEIHEGSNYQCTMDTLMQAYNHRNTSSNTQFAYCFN